MRVIICGAGMVGSNIARYLASEDADITVIDTTPALVQKLTDSLDVKGLVGFASHPDVLERAGAVDADMVIAVTYADEVNMVACQICHSIFDVPTKIARIRHQSYLQPMWADLFSRDHMPIDVIISPELEVAQAIGRRLEIPGAFDVIPVADGRVSLLGVHCTEELPGSQHTAAPAHPAVSGPAHRRGRYLSQRQGLHSLSRARDSERR